MQTLKTLNITQVVQSSSKGNQLKYYDSINKLWYKADDLGYEGISEVIVSRLLKAINFPLPFVMYYPCKFEFDGKKYKGCYSNSFLNNSVKELSIARLYEQVTCNDLFEDTDCINNTTMRIENLVNKLSGINGLNNLGNDLSLLMQLDYLILNEDRHFHNIVLLCDNDKYSLAPVFDNGASLLSDVTIDYPMGIPIFSAVKKIKSKPFNTSFKKQVSAIKELYPVELIVPSNVVLNVADLYNEYNTEFTERAMRVLKSQFTLLYPDSKLDFITDYPSLFS